MAGVQQDVVVFMRISITLSFVLVILSSGEQSMGGDVVSFSLLGDSYGALMPQNNSEWKWLEPDFWKGLSAGRIIV